MLLVTYKSNVPQHWSGHHIYFLSYFFFYKVDSVFMELLIATLLHMVLHVAMVCNLIWQRNKCTEYKLFSRCCFQMCLEANLHEPCSSQVKAGCLVISSLNPHQSTLHLITQTGFITFWVFTTFIPIYVPIQLSIVFESCFCLTTGDAQSAFTSSCISRLLIQFVYQI